MSKSVFSHINATPSDLVNMRNTARLIKENLKAQKKATEKVAYKPLVMVGPSGAGKGTLIDFLYGKFPDKFGFSVSYTTRPPRAGEVDGKDYNFVSKEKFE